LGFNFTFKIESNAAAVVVVCAVTITAAWLGVRIIR